MHHMSAATNILSELAMHIKVRRKALGLSQQDVADMCDVQRQTIGRIESADPTVAVGTVTAVTDVLGIDLVQPGARG
jgi:transcriptional regulator with XRE-family HTH domain